MVKLICKKLTDAITTFCVGRGLKEEATSACMLGGGVAVETIAPLLPELAKCKDDLERYRAQFTRIFPPPKRQPPRYIF